MVIINNEGYAMVERRFIYASKEVYMGRPKISYRSKRLYDVGGQILYGWESLICSRYYSIDCIPIPTYHTGSS